MNHQEYMQAAYNAARKGYEEGGIPIGAVLVYNNSVLGVGYNQRVQQESPILHAEIDAICNAGRQTASIYWQCTLYTTLSPCPMCTGAILLYKIPRVVIGENRTFTGEEQLLTDRGVTVQVIDDDDCYQLMQTFISENPTLWNEDIGV